MGFVPVAQLPEHRICDMLFHLAFDPNYSMSNTLSNLYGYFFVLWIPPGFSALGTKNLCENRSRLCAWHMKPTTRLLFMILACASFMCVAVVVFAISYIWVDASNVMTAAGLRFWPATLFLLSPQKVNGVRRDFFSTGNGRLSMLFKTIKHRFLDISFLQRI